MATGTLDLPDLIPARMLNEFAYCPRLAYLEWVQGDFADSADTVDGRHQHRRVDKESGDLPPADQLPSQPGDVLHARSIYLSAPKAGLVARIDLVEASAGEVSPIDYKRSEAPDIPDGAWEPERVQVCAQGIILAENGYACHDGIIYFVASRKRVPVPFTDELRARTVELATHMREVMAGADIPAPLVDSPKCPRCSLCAICLPDEDKFIVNDVINLASGEVPRTSGNPLAAPAASPSTRNHCERTNHPRNLQRTSIPSPSPFSCSLATMPATTSNSTRSTTSHIRRSQATAPLKPGVVRAKEVGAPLISVAPKRRPH